MQLLVNMLFIVAKDFYIKYSFYFSQTVGFSLILLIPLVAVAFLFKFCIPSRICAIAQIIMTILWIIIQEDNVYNITSQLIISSVALMFTYNKLKK